MLFHSICVGRGGSKIKEIQSDSGARVNVTKDTDGDNTIVRISGTDSQISKAKDLIESLTKDFNGFNISPKEEVKQEEVQEEEEDPENVIYINGWKTKKYETNKFDWQKLARESVSIS